MIKVLVVRPDRLGDVILSTPAFQAIKQQLPSSHVTAMLQPAVVPVIRGVSFLDDVWVYDPGEFAGVAGFFRLVFEIRRRAFDVAVVLQSNRRISAAIWLARVPERIGPRSKPHSFVFFNRGIRQRRSQVEMHEADYNLQLVQDLGDAVPGPITTQIYVSPEARQEAEEWLRQNGRDLTRPLVAVHPGMGGSALNWPRENYLELIRAQVGRGRQVLVTAGPPERVLLNSFRTALGEFGKQVLYYDGSSPRGVEFLGALFSFADVVVAPSTGPLHVAVALGKPVLSFYPPIRVQSAKRWGPYGVVPGKAEVLVPTVECVERFRCRGKSCRPEDVASCMSEIRVEEATMAMERLLEGNRSV